MTMADTIIVAIITGGLSLAGVVISSIASTRRMPVVEEQIKVINHRVADLEDYHK